MRKKNNIFPSVSHFLLLTSIEAREREWYGVGVWKPFAINNFICHILLEHKTSKREIERKCFIVISIAIAIAIYKQRERQGQYSG